MRRSLFGERAAAEVLLAYQREECVGFALFFANYSTFLAQPGIYPEDLFVKPEARGNGAGRALLRELARLATEGAAGAWNGRSSTGTSPLSAFTKAAAVPLSDWTIFRLTERRWKNWLRSEALSNELLLRTSECILSRARKQAVPDLFKHPVRELPDESGQLPNARL